jgi:hypothetical protein
MSKKKFPEALGAAFYGNGKLAEGDAWFDETVKTAWKGYRSYYRETKQNLATCILRM